LSAVITVVRRASARINWLIIARLLWCLTGAAAGIGLALYLIEPPISPFLLASLGGSTVFLFVLTREPAAQPRALFGGHLGGALVGITCYYFFGDALWVYAIALSLTLCLMLVTRTVHPSAGANPILMVSAHAGFSALWNPVLIGVASLALVAIVWSRVFPKLVRYPFDWKAESPSTVLLDGWED
jgi:CBS-domain-containing membrane protein